MTLSAYQADPVRLRGEIGRLSTGRVLIIGDVMLDAYLMGDVERISPEAPVPVVRIESERYFVGGAGNVARNVKALGGDACLLSVCGTEKNGRAIKKLLRSEGICDALLPLGDRPTTVKTRVIARNQQMLRIDKELCSPLAKKTLESLRTNLAELLPNYGVVVISDYGKGLVSKEFMDMLRECAAASGNAPRIFVDPKTPNYPFYNGAHLLTPNTKETGEASGMPVTSREQIIAAGTSLFSKLNCSHVLTTLGAQGMAFFAGQTEVWHIPTVAQKVFDVTGAGDTVMATVALAMSVNVSPLDACVLANYAAGIVVGEVGAAVAKPNQLLQAIELCPPPDIRRWA